MASTILFFAPTCFVPSASCASCCRGTGFAATPARAANVSAVRWKSWGPDDIADELAQLQDNVPPFPDSEARAIIEKSLGKPVGELFARFDRYTPRSCMMAAR